MADFNVGELVWKWLVRNWFDGGPHAAADLRKQVESMHFGLLDEGDTWTDAGDGFVHHAHNGETCCIFDESQTQSLPYCVHRGYPIWP